MQRDGAIFIERLVLFCCKKNQNMETRHSKQVDKLYKENVMLFPQWQAMLDNDYDCLVENNLEMYELMILRRKNLPAMMVLKCTLINTWCIAN